LASCGRRHQGFIGSARSRIAQPLLELAYRAFLKVRPLMQRIPMKFERSASEAERRWLVRELRSNHAGELGAIAIYRGVLAVSRGTQLREFANRHLATEQQHLNRMLELLPRSRRSKLLPLWRAAGFLTGALPAACGEDAVYATIDAVETFVERHYRAQIERLAGDSDRAALCDTLRACMDDELAHRDEARARLAGRSGPILRLWLLAVTGGSALGVIIARRI
jgi:ubiquinone biosynthesis monooxygenase Coq7